MLSKGHEFGKKNNLIGVILYMYKWAHISSIPAAGLMLFAVA